MSGARSFGRDTRGAVAIVFALAIPVLLGAAGAALDYSRLVAARNQLQHAADQAALQGARALGATSGTASAKESAGHKAAADAVAGSAPIATKNISAVGTSQTVSVTLSSDLKLLFGRFLGVDASTVSVNAISQYKDLPVPVCLLALEPSATGITFEGNGSFLGDGCVIWSNSTSPSASILLKGSSKIKAKTICSNGKTSYSGTNTVTPAPRDNCGVFPNPFASWTPPSVASATCQYRGSISTTTANPGVYCSGSKINSSSNLELKPGIYVVKDIDLVISASARITGTDVQFILLGNSTISITAGADLELTAPQDASGTRMLIARADSSTPSNASVITGNAALKVNGSIYLPKGNLQIKGNGVVSVTLPEQSIVAKTITVGGSGKIEFRGREREVAPNGTVEGQITTRLVQ